jgi:DNA-binding transcriptional ArsR family regulator
MFAGYLRLCASSEIMLCVTDLLELAAASDAAVQTTQRDCADVSPEADRQRYAAISRALADPKRLCVLEILAMGERSVSQLSRDASCQIPNMSQHLAVLRSCGLVTTRREGNAVLYRLSDRKVLEAYRLIQAIAG